MEITKDDLIKLVERAKKIGVILLKERESNFYGVKIYEDGEIYAEFSNRYDNDIESCAIDISNLVDSDEEKVLQDAQDLRKILDYNEAKAKEKIESSIRAKAKEERMREYEKLKAEFEQK